MDFFGNKQRDRSRSDELDAMDILIKQEVDRLSRVVRVGAAVAQMSDEACSTYTDVAAKDVSDVQMLLAALEIVRTYTMEVATVAVDPASGKYRDTQRQLGLDDKDFVEHMAAIAESCVDCLFVLTKLIAAGKENSDKLIREEAQSAVS